MGHSLLSSECTRIHAGLLGADDSLSDAARSLITGSAVVVPTSGFHHMLPAALAPTSGHHAGHSHVRYQHVPPPLNVDINGVSLLHQSSCARPRAGP